jgi:hypothetical protein
MVLNSKTNIQTRVFNPQRFYSQFDNKSSLFS